jgi:hypothetical protein
MEIILAKLILFGMAGLLRNLAKRDEAAYSVDE